MNYKTTVILLSGLAGVVPSQAREHHETTIVLRLPAPPAAAFPLFGPVRETEWSPHWSPRFVFPPEPTQETGAVFTTRKGDTDAVWVLAAYDEAALRITYVILWPGMCATKLDIALTATGDGATEATVTYRQTALSEAGDRYVTEFSHDFPRERDHWEQAISHRLLALRKK